MLTVSAPAESPVFFSSIVIIHAYPHVLTLTSGGWHIAGGPEATIAALGGIRWKTFEDARADLAIEAELALQRAAAGTGVTVGEA